MKKTNLKSPERVENDLSWFSFPFFLIKLKRNLNRTKFLNVGTVIEILF